MIGNNATFIVGMQLDSQADIGDSSSSSRRGHLALQNPQLPEARDLGRRERSMSVATTFATSNCARGTATSSSSGNGRAALRLANRRDE